MYLGAILCGPYQFAERNVKLESIKRNRLGKYFAHSLLASWGFPGVFVSIYRLRVKLILSVSACFVNGRKSVGLKYLDFKEKVRHFH